MNKIISIFNRGSLHKFIFDYSAPVQVPVLVYPYSDDLDYIGADVIFPVKPTHTIHPPVLNLSFLLIVKPSNPKPG